jgi:hypothetical protein
MLIGAEGIERVWVLKRTTDRKQRRNEKDYRLLKPPRDESVCPIRTQGGLDSISPT